MKAKWALLGEMAVFIVSVISMGELLLHFVILNYCAQQIKVTENFR